MITSDQREGGTRQHTNPRESNDKREEERVCGSERGQRKRDAWRADERGRGEREHPDITPADLDRTGSKMG